ncbi:MAG: glucose PTS transporter subunit IIA [Chloroflexi bacterium]|nr:glucose PTS transporter subunit IIA [Chloroflexota bacterium]
MGLFDTLKDAATTKHTDTNIFQIFAPLSGEIVPLGEVPDAVFAHKILGDGVAIKPNGDKMVAPCDGTIAMIFDGNHGFTMTTDTGLTIIVQFGIDTQNLKGEGFVRIAHEGQRLSKGQTVITFDLFLLQGKAKSILSPVVVYMDNKRELMKTSGFVTAGEHAILCVKQ